MRLVDEIVKLNIALDSFESLLYSFHHHLSIPEGKFNTVVHLCQVGVGLLSFQRETGEILRDLKLHFIPHLNGQAMIVLCNRVSYIPGTGVYHNPDIAVGTLLDLNKMITASKSTNLIEIGRASCREKETIGR